MEPTPTELDLSPEGRAILDTVHRFARDVLRPAGVELDRMADPCDVIAPGSVLWDVHTKYRGLGVHQLADFDDFDPIERSLLTATINEELGWGDAGLAISLSVSGFPRFFGPLTGDTELIDRYFGPDSTSIGCWAITEPDHGRRGGVPQRALRHVRHARSSPRLRP